MCENEVNFCSSSSETSCKALSHDTLSQIGQIDLINENAWLRPAALTSCRQLPVLACKQAMAALLLELC